MNPLELTGQVRTHIKQYHQPRFAAEPETASAFLKMKKAAEKEGYHLEAFSAFRDFKSQLKIWNNKHLGKRPLFNRDGTSKDYDMLTPKEVVYSILDWSALPGASRHHWGTEIDVVDSAAIPEAYQIKLLPEEYEEGGVFFSLNHWLTNNIERFGFFRPYREDKGGVNPEPWHLSYRPVSGQLLPALSLELLKTTTENNALLGKEIVLESLSDIYMKYVVNISD